MGAIKCFLLQHLAELGELLHKRRDLVFSKDIPHGGDQFEIVERRLAVGGKRKKTVALNPMIIAESQRRVVVSGIPKLRQNRETEKLGNGFISQHQLPQPLYVDGIASEELAQLLAHRRRKTVDDLLAHHTQILAFAAFGCLPKNPHFRTVLRHSIEERFDQIIVYRRAGLCRNRRSANNHLVLGSFRQFPSKRLFAIGIDVQAPRHASWRPDFLLAGPVQRAKLTDFLLLAVAGGDKCFGGLESLLNGGSVGERMIKLLGKLRGYFIIDGNSSGDHRFNAAGKQFLHLIMRGAAVQKNQLQRFLLPQQLRQTGGVGHFRLANASLQLQMRAAGVPAVVENRDAVGVAIE